MKSLFNIFLYAKGREILEKVCFYFFEKLKIFQKNKNKPPLFSLPRVQQKAGFYPVLCIIMMVLCPSCTHEKTEPTCTTPTTVSFQQQIVPIFNQQCNTSGCHSGTAPAGNLNLEASVAYAQLSKKGSGYLDTVTPQYSVLFSSMNATANPMPPTGKLDKCTVDLVLKWIQQKAPNN